MSQIFKSKPKFEGFKVIKDLGKNIKIKIKDKIDTIHKSRVKGFYK